MKAASATAALRCWLRPASVTSGTRSASGIGETHERETPRRGGAQGESHGIAKWIAMGGRHGPDAVRVQRERTGDRAATRALHADVSGHVLQRRLPAGPA